MNKIMDNLEERCTGCSACMNACPTNAIEMKENLEGFLFPSIDDNKCINCKKCSSICPANNLVKDNCLSEKMYAVEADDETRVISSSGGVFSVVAKYFLQNDGYVCGAAFDKKLQLRHVIINKLEDLPQLCKSKYLQSSIGYIFSDIKQLLDKGKNVLFVGTPCQVAGLNNYLIKKYDNLLTMDLMCHGVPSQKSFNKYLEEIETCKGVSAVDCTFRLKHNGWLGSAERIMIKFKDDSTYSKTRSAGDPYVKAFLENIDLRKSCEDCPFSELPRHGDLSIGDFWGIEKYKKEPIDNKGTSIVLINNKKGEMFFNKCIKLNTKNEEYNFSDNMPNRVHRIFKHSRFRKQFFLELENKSFSNALNQSITLSDDKNTFFAGKRYDVGLVCNYSALNFGGSLTQYALFNVLKDLGKSVLLIERPKNAPEAIYPNIYHQMYNKWPYLKQDTSPQFNDKNEMKLLNQYCDRFIVGSDVLFRASLYKKMGKISSLSWVNNDKPKIAYAASYGFDFMEGSYDDNAELSYFLKKFDAFSCREKSGIKLFKNFFGIDSTFVLDPVFLCDKKHYENLINKSNKQIKSGSICCYILDPNDYKRNVILQVSKTLNNNPIIFSEFLSEKANSLLKKHFFDFNCVNYTIEDRLKCFKESSFVITDSFHGTCLAIIYNKPFICMPNAERGLTRFDSLLNFFRLNNRAIISKNVISPEIVLKSINYKSVNKKIKKTVAKNKKWLLHALAIKPHIGYSQYDILSRKLTEYQNNEIATIKKQIKFLYSKINCLPLINDIKQYFTKLSELSEHLTIIISVKDTPGIELSKPFAEFIKNNVKSNCNLANNHQNSYILINSFGKNIFEMLSAEKITKVVKCDNFEINVTSANLKVGNESSILINGKEYSINQRGLNIVIIDHFCNVVIDSINIDTHLIPYKFNHLPVI
ncbi:MAG: Coenzyme F420 hydrogenase/dehydrogenase, beta subunit C-terminal domain [Bacilli bacterium]|nr:Coenzyme F420 hydrogenase/dehydrogenase, beta subunit C-terminal domain [Bacilli bacterium]